MKNNQQGFTLIELMIVIAIIAILAAIALPAYQDYLIRSQVSEGAVLSSGAKTAVAEFYSNTGHYPLNNASAGLAVAASIEGTYVTGVDISATPGIIAATFGNDANDAIDTAILSFSALTTAGSITWICKDGGGTKKVEDKYLPTSCRS